MNVRFIITITFCVIFILTSSCQNDVKTFKNLTVANEPTLQINSRLLLSVSKVPNHNDFVAYEYKTDTISEIRIHKMVAKENDTLEIIDGIVYVNKKNIDDGKNLMHFYILPKSDYLTIKRKENISDQFYAFASSKDSVTALLEDKIAEKYNWKSARQVRKREIQDPLIQKVYNQNWNQDNFGPLVIPKNKTFVIGENRHNSEDSRYIGLIDETQILGVISTNK